ncbi:MAG: hypothetical protein A2Y97_13720 [Nitrospirae bacterium RBG_13_39_12]|nr:MAG: hypothetical protein A2Y97_13720 [Nitrospirae bacterium RBG_13_39_12]
MKKFTLILFFSFSFLISTSLFCSSAEKEMIIAKDLTVQIISPKEGERVHGNIAIEARVNHPEAVRYCEFYIQEPGAKDRYSWKDYTSPYSWGGDGQTLDTTLFNDGQASVVAFCFPKDSQSAMFQKRIYFTIENGKPVVEIISPEDQAMINGKTLVRVDARDPKGIKSSPGITGIYIYVNGGLYQKLTKPPYHCSLETCLLCSGFHSIRVVAEDSEGLTNSDIIIINVPPEGTSLQTEKK